MYYLSVLLARKLTSGKGFPRRGRKTVAVGKRGSEEEEIEMPLKARKI